MGATDLHHMLIQLVDACHRYQYTDSCLSISPAATFAPYLVLSVKSGLRHRANVAAGLPVALNDCT